MGLLGAHVSTAGGLHKAVERGIDMGCQAIQIFTKNQMQWQSRPLEDEEVELYHRIWHEVGADFPVLSHDSYLINLGSPDEEKLEKSRKSFLVEMDRAEKLGVSYLVFHPGSHLNKFSLEQCLKTIADSLNLVLESCPDYKVKVLIENTAGQGSNVGCRFEHIAEILAQLDYPERAGVCLDTCHTLAAGYDIRTEESYQETLETFDRIVGLKWIRAFHLNDSKKPLGSRVDRHEHIGKGCVGLETFKFIVNDSRFTDIPMILETPGDDEDYKKNLDLLKSLVK